MISASLENYLELIHNEILNNKNIKAIDIANKLHISRSSVSEALTKLVNKELIIYEGRHEIQLTQKGIELAQKTTKKHEVLSNFFNKILNIDEEIADKNACRIEHVIDDEIIEKIIQYTESHA